MIGISTKICQNESSDQKVSAVAAAARTNEMANAGLRPMYCVT